MLKGLWVFVLVAGWAVLIYGGSAQPYEEQDIKPILREIISEETLSRLLPNITFSYAGSVVDTSANPYGATEFFIRKGVHITEYFIFTILLKWAFGQVVSYGSGMSLAALLAVTWAGLDEYRQLGTAGRTGHPLDVAVDTVGVVLAVLILLLWRVATGPSRRVQTAGRTNLPVRRPRRWRHERRT